MSKFATEIVETIKAREVVEQLLIDGVRQLDIFEEELKGTTYLSEYKSLLTYIQFVANGNRLPEKKFKQLKGANGVNEYEFKSKHIRIYAIQQSSRKIIIFLGFKNNQPKDIVIFRSLKERFINYLKQTAE